jgi:excisionase family DNA binding protein
LSKVIWPMSKLPDWKGLAAWACCATASVADLAPVHATPACEAVVLTLQETADLLRVPSNELKRLAEQREIPARRIGDTWRFNCASVMEWLNGDGSLAAADSREFHRLLSSQELNDVAGGGGASQEAPVPTEADRNGTDFERERVGEAPDERTAEDIRLREQRVLVNPRDVSLNIGQFYSESDSLVFAASDQGNVLATLEQAALLTTFQARFGVSSKAELFLSTSYVDQDSDLTLGSQKLASSGNREFGNVLFGARRTLMREGVGRPSIIGTLTAHIPTEDRAYALGGGLGFVKSFDPVALFASVNYTHRFSEDFTEITRLEPEDRLDASVGLALALNDTLSVSGSVSAVFTAAVTSPSASLRRQESYSVGFGLTSRVSRAIYLEPAVSLGLGGPADGFAFGLSVFRLKPSRGN